MSQNEDTTGPKSHIPQLDNLIDDDEFEDFGIEGWDPKQGNANDAALWYQDWDSENIEDDFTRQLREELQKPKPKPEQDSADMQQ
ncbi:hypothetical protein HDU83_006318 [Entophlyctis luteolus]|nr:hypothetical protein HDU82_008128 [Entophlyctis luteolus]KAJ3353826.1 hypothetical protein HDU83_006318 [Entophlyctis luteolus]